MTTSDYSAQQALELLLRKLHERAPSLEERVRSAIDAGQDAERQQLVGAGTRMRSRSYRQTVRFTDRQGVYAALDVFRAYFVEQPLFVMSAAHELQQADLSVRRDGGRSPEIPTRETQAVLEQEPALDERIEFELQTETRISPTDRETLALPVVSESLVSAQRENLAKLAILIDLGEA